MSLECGVEKWLKQLNDSMASSVREFIIQAVQDLHNGVAVEELAVKVGSYFHVDLEIYVHCHSGQTYRDTRVRPFVCLQTL